MRNTCTAVRAPAVRGTERMRRRGDFEAVMRGGRSWRQPLLSLRARRNAFGYNRYGFAVGRQVGGAVVRNRVRRRLRSLVRELPPGTGYDVVITARYGSVRASFRELSSELVGCAHGVGIIASEDR